VATHRLIHASDRASTLQLLLEVRRYDDALAVLGRIVDNKPSDIPAAFDALADDYESVISYASRSRVDTIRPLIKAAKAHLTSLPREQAARAARAIASVESRSDSRPDAWRSLLKAFVNKYAGTEVALLAQVDLLDDVSNPNRVAALDAFVRAHPGTNPGAKALFSKGFALANGPFGLVDRPGGNPTDRFFEVLDISRQLKSGAYPPSEWTKRALSLVVESSAYKPSFAPGNIERMLSAYEGLLPVVADIRPRSDSVLCR